MKMILESLTNLTVIMVSIPRNPEIRKLLINIVENIWDA